MGCPTFELGHLKKSFFSNSSFEIYNPDHQVYPNLTHFPTFHLTNDKNQIDSTSSVAPSNRLSWFLTAFIPYLAYVPGSIIESAVYFFHPSFLSVLSPWFAFAVGST